MEKICNEDCFNCQYDDCVNDELLTKDKPAIKELKMDPRNVRKRAAYHKNREKYCAQKRARYAEHREEICAKRRKKPEERKPRYRKTLCAHCKHFIRRSEGKKGGLWGMCERSSKDCRAFADWGFTRPVGQRYKCLRFERLETEDAK